MQSVLQDLRYALRQLRRNPGFALLAVLTLALGIGANTAVFSIFYQVMLRDLPVRNPGSLVLLSEHLEAESGGLHSHGDDKLYFSYPAYRALQAGDHVFQGVLGSGPMMLAIAGQDHTEQAWGELVSGNYFDVLGMRPALGRLLTPADDAQRGGNPYAVLSYAYWQSRFGGNPAILDTTIHLNSQLFQVVGVAAPGYTGLNPEETPALFVPMSMETALGGREDFLDAPNQRWMNVLARLRPGVSAMQAQTAMAPVWRSVRQSALAQVQHRNSGLDRQFMDSHLFVHSGAQGLPMLRDDFGAPLIALMGMVLAVLLIACGNVANLLLVRAASRRREMAIRGALGAARALLFRQALLEGLVLGAIAAVLGAALGQAGARLLVGALPAESGISGALSARLDLRVLAFTIVIGLLTTLLFSLAPAFAGARVEMTSALHRQSSAARGGSSRIRNILVSAEVMLSLVLLVLAGLFVHTLYNMQSLNPGFRPDHLLTFSVDAKLLGRDAAATRAEYQRLAETLRQQPGVGSVAYSSISLLSGDYRGGNVSIAGYVPAQGDELDMNLDVVSPGFFSTLRVPLLAGRTFTPADHTGGHKVGIVNQSFATRFFGSPRAALGHAFCFHCIGVTPDTEIVGVVSDVKTGAIRDLPAPFFYLPSDQSEEALPASFYLLTAQDPAAAADAIRRAVAAVDPELPVQYLEPMQVHIDTSLFQERLVSKLSIAFGALAAFLAALGLYGVLAYSVAQRTQEIGVRMALGANRGQVVRLVMGQVLRMAGAGIVLGLPISAAVAHLLKNQLYGISGSDPAVFVSVVLALVFLALLAGLLPARKAASVEPMRALRTE